VLFASLWLQLANGYQKTASPFPLEKNTGACAAREFRQFDFWLGKWNVSDPGGKPVGTNEIKRESEGCALSEHWIGGDGISGTSLNY
jgi:hypothetical protein